MINIQTKIHDQFSIEFKVGFSGTEGVKTDHGGGMDGMM